MIGLTVALLLAALAYPAYTAQLRSSRRVDGQQGLQALAARLEQHHQRWGVYGGPGTGPGGWPDEASPAGHYRLQVLAATGEGYRLAAVPVGSQTADACATLTYDHLGRTGSSAPTTVGRCWP